MNPSIFDLNALSTFLTHVVVYFFDCRIDALEQSEQRMQVAVRNEGEGKKKLMKDIEHCRIDAIKEVAKAKDEYSKRVKSNQEERERMQHEHSSEVESLTMELKILQEKNNRDITELKASLQASDSNVKTLTLQLKELQNQSAQEIADTSAGYDLHIKELEASIQLKSSESDALRETVVRLEEQMQKTKGYDDELMQVNEKLELSASKHAELEKEKSQLVEKLNESEKECNALKDSLEKAKTSGNSEYEDLSNKLDKKKDSERVLKGELAQKKQLISILQSNEKLLEEHVAALEDQINKLVSHYESKLVKADNPPDSE